MSIVSTRPDEQPSLWWTPLRSRARWVFVAAATVSAVAHIPVIAPHLREAPYMGEEFIVLTAACMLIALAALVCDSVVVYRLGALTCAPAVTGYLATRLIEFPHLSDDVGNWLEPLGITSVAAELTTITAAGCALLARTSQSPTFDH